ncbi:hypothetical protein AWC38_SpisGene20965 [Stylophora pistillata]|uniref:Uncharacterized protein n=1 Tax=Stylophora pistillata TaxID=50429 RepID=A0A2B4RDG1_STYPI|nr:hypothetical protein AWC38_SpisGene20965 [Stylophora pistillata]
MQLSSLKSITRDNVIFEEATTNQHGHERINIKITGAAAEAAARPLVIASPFRFSFGVQPSLNKSGDVVGYTLPTPLWNHQRGEASEPTQKEFAFYEALKELKHICYQYLDEVYGTDVAESIKFPLVEKEGKAPVLYPRLMYSQKSGYKDTNKDNVIFKNEEKDEWEYNSTKVLKQLKQSHYKLTNMEVTSLKEVSTSINEDNVIFEEQETESKYDIYIEEMKQLLEKREEEKEEEVSDIQLHLQYREIHKFIAQKEAMNLLTKKQKKVLFTTLLSGDDYFSIYLTQRQCCGGFLSTLSAHVSHFGLGYK